MEYEDRVAILTPEGLELDYSLAGAGSRIFAGWVDIMLRLLVLGAAIFVGYAIARGVGAGLVALVGTFLALFVYDIAFEVWGGGQTPAKRWNGLRVVMDDGRPVGFAASAVRNLLRLIDVWVTIGTVGIVSIFVTRRDQRLGDLAAGTLVIREPKIQTQSEAHYAQLMVGIDVTAVSAAELATVRDFLSRRNDLAPAARARVAENLSERLAPKIGGLPPGTHEPEQILETIAAAKSGA
ncbi:MAG: RDD family protein [Solirubrobacterales bacterium]|nr:RDD family protein [Solirubrobacterales bacterium]